MTEERIRAEGDSSHIEEKSLTKVSFVLWNYDIDELVENLFRKERKEDAWEIRAWKTWYESYVTEKYLNVPKGMEQVKKIAEEIRTSDKSFFRVEGKESVNFERLNAAYQVADWMWRNTTYSLELPELPKGEDAIEYFLGTGRQCG